MEEAEKTKDSRLAREFVAALPIELSRQQQIELLQDFIRKQFVDEGMCADVAIHDTDGHNPHAHTQSASGRVYPVLCYRAQAQ